MLDISLVADLPDELLRVHWQPDVLKRPPYDLDPEAMSRFDDPEGRFGVRYLATHLRGCLVETMARFRPSPAVESLLAAVQGVETDDIDPTRETGLLEWLSAQKVGHCVISVADPSIVDVDAAESLVALNKHPGVRIALDQSGLGSSANPARLDAGVIRLPGPVGRPITQAVSRAVYEWYDGVHGLRYASRLDGAELCWGLYDSTPVTFTIESLRVDEPDHREAVQSVAALFEIALPEEWQ